jgi:hypothetical protein
VLVRRIREVQMALALPLAVKEMGSAQTWGSTADTLGRSAQGVNQIWLTNLEEFQEGSRRRRRDRRLITRWRMAPSSG